MVEQKPEKLLVGGSSPSPNIKCLAELVDAVDLKSISFMSIGSSPIAVKFKKNRENSLSLTGENFTLSQ